MNRETLQDSDRQPATQEQQESKQSPNDIASELTTKVAIAHPGEIEREFRGLVPHPREVERGERELKPIPAEDNGIPAQDLGLAPARVQERPRLPEMGEMANAEIRRQTKFRMYGFMMVKFTI
jgi:hypothetical protein